MKPEAGQWWCMKDEPSVMVWSVGLSACGNWVIEWSDGTTSMSCPDDFYHEPRCTGWDWVVPKEEPQPAEETNQKPIEVTDRRGVVLVPGQEVLVLQTEQTRLATVVKVTESRSSSGWWVDVDLGHGPEGVPSDILEVCNSEEPQPQKTYAVHDWSYHNQQKPQPKKVMLRLWIDPDCNIHAGLKNDGDLELHYDHETRQFYTEEQP